MVTEMLLVPREKWNKLEKEAQRVRSSEPIDKKPEEVPQEKKRMTSMGPKKLRMILGMMSF